MKCNSPNGRIVWLQLMALLGSFSIALQLGIKCAYSATPSSGKTASQSVVLRYKGRVGDTMRYRSWFRMRILGRAPQVQTGRSMRTTFSYESVHVHKITNVSEDGTLEMESSRESAKLQRNGREEDLSDKPYKRVVRMTNRGKVIDEKTIEGEEEEESDEKKAQRLTDPGYLMDEVYTKAVHNITFPEGAVRKGTQWTNTVTEEVAPGISMRITIKSKVADFVQLNGYKCAVIESEITAPLDFDAKMGKFNIALTGELKAWATLYFDYEKGVEVLSEDQIRMVI
ncbi:MAG TPA: hypothetical protein EYP10_00235, partial [Armatimonadetes bacterium]|nr:hypothetical protein [Armatimonadota bacterium]